MGKIARGTIVLVSLDPTIGSEQAGTRPMLVVSGNALNDSAGIIIACPLSSKIKNFPGNVVLVPDSQNKLDKPSEVLVAHIRSVSQSRIISAIGICNWEVVKKVLSGFDSVCDR